MEDDWLMFVTGVIPAISSSVRKLTTPAENVVIMTPVYNIFLTVFLIMAEMCYRASLYTIMADMR